MAAPMRAGVSGCRVPRPLPQPASVAGAAFRRFGTVIAMDSRPPDKVGNFWRVVMRERRARGWRIACLGVRRQPLCEVEQHPDSWESFEPLSGTAWLFVAAGERPGRLRCFLLDQPVILRKAVWHGLLSLTPYTYLKITENNHVRVRRCRLIEPVQPPTASV